MLLVVCVRCHHIDGVEEKKSDTTAGTNAPSSEHRQTSTKTPYILLRIHLCSLVVVAENEDVVSPAGLSEVVVLGMRRLHDELGHVAGDEEEGQAARRTAGGNHAPPRVTVSEEYKRRAQPRALLAAAVEDTGLDSVEPAVDIFEDQTTLMR